MNKITTVTTNLTVNHSIYLPFDMRKLIRSEQYFYHIQKCTVCVQLSSESYTVCYRKGIMSVKEYEDGNLDGWSDFCIEYSRSIDQTVEELINNL